ncbi:hypothetical protein, partial [Acetobacter orientalis]|uniref:hypothetical protein n=1 Tax=Acetobacter orientalis TaxID=146474 RepID=UPI00241DE480
MAAKRPYGGFKGAMGYVALVTLCLSAPSMWGGATGLPRAYAYTSAGLCAGSGMPPTRAPMVLAHERPGVLNPAGGCGLAGGYAPFIWHPAFVGLASKRVPRHFASASASA